MADLGEIVDTDRVGSLYSCKVDRMSRAEKMETEMRPGEIQLTDSARIERGMRRLASTSSDSLNGVFEAA